MYLYYKFTICTNIVLFDKNWSPQPKPDTCVSKEENETIILTKIGNITKQSVDYEIENYVRYFHFDPYLWSFHALRHFCYFRSFHFDTIIHFDIFTSIYKFNSKSRIYTLRSFHALRLKTLHRSFHFGFFVTWVHSLRPMISLRYIHFDILKFFHITFTSIHSLRHKSVWVEVPCTST